MEGLTWYGQASFRISTGGTQVYIDPWRLPSGLPAANLVCVTHAHADHFSSADIAKIAVETTVVLLPGDVTLPPSIKVQQVHVMTPGKSITHGGITVSAIPAYNNAKPSHPKAKNWMGYVVSVGGFKYFHAGDTDCISEMSQLSSQAIDVALLPVGGTYTMDGKEAAQAVELIRPKIAVPMHYGSVVGSIADAKMLESLTTVCPVKIMTATQ
eukprot:TRINITY_DN28307_c0_g1_i2.p1 TRINITY_DN28307_c0_g1~~TRINITY_DN28307_c0_g1_i2.p1  ORF type:complete len:212 (-),score=23.95 TRINITY_DN28307_c0_g1_i2:149-784(-)